MCDIFGFVSMKCPQCGKTFERLSTDWVYKTVCSSGVKYYCRYSCWRAAEMEKSSDRSRRLTKEEKRKMFRMLDQGVKVEIIAKKLRVSENCILYHRKKRK